MNYFDLLPTVRDKSKIEDRIARFESAEGIQLPVLYKTFISTFETDLITKSELLSYWNPNFQTQLQIYRVDFPADDQVSLDSFFVLEDIARVREQFYSKDHDYLRNDYIPIGESFDQGILMLGVTDKNMDQIFVEHAFEEARVRKVSENIFAFLQGFSFTLEESKLPKGKTAGDLYKNWSEAFWRIR